MSVKVPRAPRAKDVPEAEARLAELRALVQSDGRRGRGLESVSFGPAICLFMGLGALLFAAGICIKVAPRSLVAQIALAIWGGLPFGG